MSRVQNHTGAFTDRPFEGEGASLYATIGSRVVYRALRVLPTSRHRRRRAGWIKGEGGRHDIATDPVAKTSRRAKLDSPDDEFAYTVPAEFASQTVRFDVRQFKDDVENESDNVGTAGVTFDSGLDDDTGIIGLATLLAVEQRAGGVCRIRFAYDASPSGLQPDSFTASATAGPTSPAGVNEPYVAGVRVYEIDTPPLSDTAPYTYRIMAAHNATFNLAFILTGINVTADASGPDAPTGTAEAY